MLKRIALFLSVVITAGTLPANTPAAPAVEQQQVAKFSETLYVSIIKKDVAALDKFLDPEFVRLLQANGLTRQDFFARLSKNIDQMNSQMNMNPEQALALAMALYNGDSAFIWNTLPQEIKTQIIQKHGDEKKAQAATDEGIKKIQTELRSELTKSIVMRNGKLFFRPSDPEKAINKLKAEKNPPARTVKQSTKAEAAESFANAVSTGDAAVYWELIAPEIKQKLIAECGSQQAVLEMLGEQIKADDDYKKMLEDPKMKQLLINHLIESADKNNAWVNSDGKWYLDFGRFAQK